MSRKPSRLFDAVAFATLTIVAVAVGVVLVAADYLADKSAAVRRRLRAITRV